MQNKNRYEFIDNKDYINFSEFPLVVSLLSLGFEIEANNQDPKNTGRIEFAFKKTEAIGIAITKYWNGNLLIEPKRFWNISRELKSRIRSLR